MRLSDVKVKQGRIETERAEVLVFAQFEGDATLRDAAAAVDSSLSGALRDLFKNKEFQGKQNQTVLLHTQGKIPAKRVLLVGLGKKAEVRIDSVRQAMASVAKRVQQAGASSFHTVLHDQGLSRTSPAFLARAMVEGASLAGYEFTAYRSDPKANCKGPNEMIVVESDVSRLAAIKQGVQQGLASADATWFVRDLCNHPSNVMTPARLVNEARSVAKEHGVKLKVLERRDMEKLGMGALLGVARGSHEPPKFIILEYQRGRSAGNGRSAKPIVLVGKTITFDTGGISIKPAENMEQMKADMTGGAEVLATIRAVSRLRLPLHVIGILPATENMPGGGAIKPGDILKTLSGKTVEVQNTDAEGRLILADGLAYATRYKPRAIIDVATLTGACIVALGKFAIGMFGNDDALKRRVEKAGEMAGERVWEMPLWQEYFEQLKSEVADMRNIGGRGAGMITAALFLSKFVGDCPWIHLDIASTDWSDSERPYIAKGPTGTGTRLLIQYLLNEATTEA